MRKTPGMAQARKGVAEMATKGSGSKSSGSRQTVHRDSKDGQFVTKRYADTHKSTTEKQHIRRDK